MKQKKAGVAATVITIIGFIAVVVIIVILILNATKKNEKKETAATQQTEQEETYDVIPYGDEGAESFAYEGDYFDTATMKGTMTIISGDNGYDVSITYSDSSYVISVWTMTARYDKARRALMYADCQRTDHILEPADTTKTSEGEETTSETGETASETGETASEAAEPASELVSEIVYTSGSGAVYLSGGNLFWQDDEEDMGSGLLFEKVETKNDTAGE